MPHNPAFHSLFLLLLFYPLIPASPASPSCPLPAALNLSTPKASLDQAIARHCFPGPYHVPPTLHKPASPAEARHHWATSIVNSRDWINKFNFSGFEGLNTIGPPSAPPPSGILLGDSVAIALLPAFVQAAHEQTLSLLVSVGPGCGCQFDRPHHVERCASVLARARAAVAANTTLLPPGAPVFFACRMTHWRKGFLEFVKEEIDVIRAAGHRLVMVLEPPPFGVVLNDCVGRAGLAGCPGELESGWVKAGVHGKMVAQCEEIGVERLDFEEYLRGSKEFFYKAVVWEYAPLFKDEFHLNTVGSLYVSPVVNEFLKTHRAMFGAS